MAVVHTAGELESLIWSVGTGLKSASIGSAALHSLKDNSSILNIEPAFWFVQDEIEWLTLTLTIAPVSGIWLI